MPSVPPDLQERFRRDVERLIGGTGKIGLAVSGGADSLALLLIAHTVMPDRVEAATVDHGLRPEAAHEASFVSDICAKLGVRHRILTPDSPISGSLQSSARAARYDLLTRWADDHNIGWTATAHHIEDQAETLMMRLLRGSGIEGLSAIRVRSGRIIRPLITWHRAELRVIVDAAGISPVDDPSNHDPHFDRVRMRQWLAQNEWLDADALAKSAAALSMANDALEWAAEREAEHRISHDRAGIAIDPDNLPEELLRRLIMTSLRRLAPTIAPRGDQISAVIEALRQGKKMTLGTVICRGGATWHFAAAPPRRTN